MDTKEQASQPALQTLKEYAVITAAVLIMDIGIYVFKFPNNFSFGGVSGMAVVICRFLPFTASQINLFINLLLLLVGFAVLGRNFGVKTAYVTVLSSVLLNIFEKLFPMAHPLTDEIMLELCFAIILPALAAALLFFENASGGGTDIIAMIVNKYKTISYGRIVMTVDSMIILSSLFVGDMGVDSVIYGFVVTAVLGYTVDVIQAGNQQSSQIFVFTRRYEAMADQIIATTRHSATILDATGWYSKEDIKVVVVVCRKRETSQLLKLVRGVDGDAFISVGSVMGVYGKGFEALNKV